MAAAPGTATALSINCGFCRVAIVELTDYKKCRRAINQVAREEKFSELFSCFNLDDSFFATNDKRLSLFQKRCDQVLDMFRKKWNPTSLRMKYLETFSISSWEKLSMIEKKKHLLSKCERCRQKNFPVKPVFEDALCSAVSEMIAHTSQKTKKEAITSIWSPVDSAFKAKFGESFKTSVTTSCQHLGLQSKVTPIEKRDEKRTLCRVIRDDMNKQLSASAPSSILVENQSLAMYNRQRLSQYFEQKPAKKRKSHSPTAQNWDTAGLVSYMENAPSGTKIVWQQLAGEHGITGPNRGQICKEYVTNNTSTDLSRFTFFNSSSTPVRRKCVSRKRLTGGEISCPAPPTCATVKRKWEDMIERGELSLGIPCVPYT